LSVLGQEGRKGQEGRELLNTLTFEDQTRVNLIRRDIYDLKQEITKLNQFTFDSVMMNQQVFQSIDCSLNKVKDDIQFIKKQILKKTKIKRSLPLRDPITFEIFQKLLLNAGHDFERHIIPRRIQLRLTYLILYLTGLRINEVILLQYSHFQQILQTGQFQIDHSKTGDLQFKHFIHQKGRDLLKKYKNEIDILFIHEHFQYLGSGSSFKNRHQLMPVRKFTEYINQDIKSTLFNCGIQQYITSHSFRIAFITKLLKNTSLQNVSQIVGHKSVNTTMLYNRFQLSDEEKEILFDKAFSLDI